MAHHGSRHSSLPELLKALHPSIAVISCGTGNDYGHPTKEAMDRLAAQGTKFYRTDIDGEVRITTDGNSLNVVHGNPGEPEAVEPTAADHTKPGTKAKRGGGGKDDPDTMADDPKPAKEPKEPKPTKPPKDEPKDEPKAEAGDGAFVASSRSKSFHKASCKGAQGLKAENLVSYPTREAAIAAGKTPAKDCNP